MTRALKARLQRLERQIQISSKFNDLMVEWWRLRILHYSIAYYVGGLAPSGIQESHNVLQLAEDAYRRALGYSDSDEFEKHSTSDDPELERRYQEALHKLLLQFGVDRDGKGMDEALKRMEDELPEDYRLKTIYLDTCVL